MLDESFLGVAPEALEAVDINLAPGESLAVIDLEVPVTAAHQGIIASEFIRVNDRSALHGFDREIHQGFSRHILDDFDLHPSVPLQEAKDGDFAPCTPTPSALASSPEIGLIQFDFPFKLMKVLGLSQNGQAEEMGGPKGGGIADSHLAGDPAARDLQLKELQDPQPLLGPEIELPNPTTGEVSEGIPASPTTVSFALQAVDFSGPATDAKSCTSFPAMLDKEQPGFILSPDKELKAFEFHDTSLILVSNH